MVKIKKMMCCVLVLATVAFPAVRAETAEDAEIYPSLLETLNIAAVSHLDPDAPMTRSDFITLACKILDFHKTNKRMFVDVAEDAPAFEYMESAVGAKLISMPADGRFYPDEEMDIHMAAKILAHMTGYGAYAEGRGGYPLGYMTVAQEIGLFKRVDTNSPTSSQFIRMIDNALETPLLELNSAGANIRFAVNDGITILSRIHQIIHIEDVVMSDGFSSLSPNIVARKDRGVIGDTGISLRQTNISQYVGMRVKAYAENNDNEYILKAIFPVNNQVIEVASHEITGCSNRRLNYLKDGKSMSVGIPVSTRILYNKKMADTNSGEEIENILFNPQNGSIRLINTDNAGYSVAVILNLDDYEVDIIDTIGYNIYTKNGSVIKYDEDTLINDKLGAEIMPWEISPGNIISVPKGHEGKPAFIYVAAQNESGEFVEISNNDDTVVLGDRTFRAAKGASLSGLRPGERVTLKFNIFGYIAAFSKDYKADGEYAYVIRYGANNSPFDPNFQIKALTQDGDIKILETAKKVSFGTTLCKNHEEVKAAAAASGLENSLVFFRTDSDGRINYIETATGIFDNPLHYKYRSSAKQVFKGVTGRFGAKVNTRVDTHVFLVSDNVNLPDEDRFVKTDLSYFATDITYVVASYGRNSDDAYSDAVVATISQTDAIDSDSDMILITSITQAHDGDDIVRTKINGISRGRQQSHFLDDSSLITAKNIEQGDVIRAKLNYVGRIADAELVYDMSAGEYKLAANPSVLEFSSRGRILYGSVWSVMGDIVRILPNTVSASPENDLENYYLKRFAIMVYDTARQKAYVGSTMDISGFYSEEYAGSRVIVQTRYADERAMIVIK